MRFTLQRICLKTLLVFVRMEEIFKPFLGFDREKMFGNATGRTFSVMTRKL